MARLKGDNIYYFRYKNPAGKGKLDVWDTAPLVIPLDIHGKSLLAVNLHWIPSQYRHQFVTFLLDYFKRQKGGRRFKRTRLYYNFIKAGKVTWAMQAIRRYHISRMTGITEVPKKKWDTVLRQRQYKAKFAYDSKFKQATRFFRKPVK
jgi:hypothetical protein